MGLIRWAMEKINTKRPKVESKGITLEMKSLLSTFATIHFTDLLPAFFGGLLRLAIITTLRCWTMFFPADRAEERYQKQNLQRLSNRSFLTQLTK